MSLIACHECDLLVELSDIPDGCRANCPRCGNRLSVGRHNGLERTFVFAVTALAFLVLANLFPFLAFKAKGHEQVMTLLEASLQLYDYGNPLLASFVLVFIIVAPAFLLFCMIWTLGPLVLKGAYAHGSVFLGRMIFHTKPWSMADVFLVGILVSMIKIAAIATVVLGSSFLAYVGFTVFFTLAVSNMDVHQFWEAIEKVRA